MPRKIVCLCGCASVLLVSHSDAAMNTCLDALEILFNGIRQRLEADIKFPCFEHNMWSVASLVEQPSSSEVVLH